MEKLKIAHVSTLFYPFIGGLEKAVQRVAEEQAKLGHEVYVITSHIYAEDRPKAERGLINIIRVDSWKNPYPYLIIPREIPEDILKSVDIVIGWGHTYYFVYRIIKEAKEKFKKVVGVYFIGVDYLRHHYNPLFRVLGYQYQKWITKRLAKVVDIAFATNEFERELLKERYSLEASMLPHGVDDIYFKLPDMANQFREKYGIKGRIIAYIGRIHPTKGLDLLIKAFAKISEAEPDLILVIAGKGDSRYLRKCLGIAKKLGIGDKVRYLGYLPEEDKIGLIDASEIIVIPSRHAGENYSILTDEVKARKKPLVVTNYGALPYRVRNMIEGVVVNADVESLVRGIKWALDNLHIFKVVEAPQTWSEIAKKLIEICEKAMKS